MNWLLDTNAIIHALNGVESVQRRLNWVTPDDQISTSILVRAELMYGAYRSARRDDNIRNIRDKLTRIHVLCGRSCSGCGTRVPRTKWVRALAPRSSALCGSACPAVVRSRMCPRS